jgi:hypothetical protein
MRHGREDVEEIVASRQLERREKREASRDTMQGHQGVHAPREEKLPKTSVLDQEYVQWAGVTEVPREEASCEAHEPLASVGKRRKARAGRGPYSIEREEMRLTACNGNPI